tara:strand:+ start:172 stop:1077 length:906 start_codon:yes stop_codon:yes gene_type:complete
MFNHYWGYGASALLGVVALLVFVFVPYRLDHQSERRDASQAEKSISEEDIERWCGGLLATERLACTARQGEAEAAKKRSQYDLKAQQEMAEWALLVVVASVISLFVSIGGLGALVWTFREQRKLTESQSRAYIEVITGRTSITEFGWTIDVTVMNTGQTPAFEVRMSANARFYARSSTRNEPEAKIIYGVGSARGEIGPSGLDTTRIYKSGTFVADEIKGLKNEEGMIVSTDECTFPYVEFVGKITFKDAFDNPREVAFHLETLEITELGSYPLSGGSERGMEQELFRLRHEHKSDKTKGV